ncbi:unnamed protein product [Rhodiola kirilowii]
MTTSTASGGDAGVSSSVKESCSSPSVKVDVQKRHLKQRIRPEIPDFDATMITQDAQYDCLKNPQ